MDRHISDHIVKFWIIRIRHTLLCHNLYKCKKSEGPNLPLNIRYLYMFERRSDDPDIRRSLTINVMGQDFLNLVSGGDKRRFHVFYIDEWSAAKEVWTHKKLPVSSLCTWCQISHQLDWNSLQPGWLRKFKQLFLTQLTQNNFGAFIRPIVTKQQQLDFYANQLRDHTCVYKHWAFSPRGQVSKCFILLLLWHILKPSIASRYHGSRIFWLTNSSDFSSIFSVFYLMNLTNTKIYLTNTLPSKKAKK